MARIKSESGNGRKLFQEGPGLLWCEDRVYNKSYWLLLQRLVVRRDNSPYVATSLAKQVFTAIIMRPTFAPIASGTALPLEQPYPLMTLLWIQLLFPSSGGHPSNLLWNPQSLFLSFVFVFFFLLLGKHGCERGYVVRAWERESCMYPSLRVVQCE